MFNSVEYLRQLCRERKIPVSQLERSCGFSNGYLNPRKLTKLPYDRAAAAAEYLGIDVLCSIQPDTRLCAAILEGTGLLKPNRANAKALRTVASWLDARRTGSARPAGSWERR